MRAGRPGSEVGECVSLDSLAEGSEFELTVPVSKLALPSERAVYPSFSSAALFDVGSCAAKRLVSSAHKAERGERVKQPPSRVIEL